MVNKDLNNALDEGICICMHIHTYIYKENRGTPFVSTKAWSYLFITRGLGDTVVFW